MLDLSILLSVSNEIKLDLKMWVVFLENFNGFTKFSTVDWSMDDTFEFYTDSSGAYGCGVVFGDEWSWLAWPSDWSHEIKKDFSFLEFVPIVLGIFIWADKLACNKLLINQNQKKLPDASLISAAMAVLGDFMGFTFGV